MRLKRIFFSIGTIFLVIGTVGVFIPILPTLPWSWLLFSVLPEVPKKLKNGLSVPTTLEAI